MVGGHEADEGADAFRGVATGASVHLLRRSGLSCNRELVQPRARPRCRPSPRPPGAAARSSSRPCAGSAAAARPAARARARPSPFGAVIRRTTNGRMSARRWRSPRRPPPSAAASPRCPARSCGSPGRCGPSRLAVAQDARRLVRQLDAGALAEAELAQPGVVALAAEAVADLGRRRCCSRTGSPRRTTASRAGASRGSSTCRAARRRSRRTARSVGLTTPCSSALAARIALKVEPGS